MPNLVEIRDLQFGYGNRNILSGLDMDFPRGKVIAVMGGSGSGKTTLSAYKAVLIRSAQGRLDHRLGQGIM